MSNKASLSDQLRTIAAFLGGSGVALGAYGAHGLIPKNTSNTSTTMDHQSSTAATVRENWKTAVMYQLIHAVSILTISTIVGSKEQQEQNRTIKSTTSSCTQSSSAIMMHRSGQVMAVGTVLFSGSIYLLCLNIGPKYIWGPTTPIGGMLIIAGWVMMLSNTSDQNDGCDKEDKL